MASCGDHIQCRNTGDFRLSGSPPQLASEMTRKRRTSDLSNRRTKIRILQRYELVIPEGFFGGLRNTPSRIVRSRDARHTARGSGHGRVVFSKRIFGRHSSPARPRGFSQRYNVPTFERSNVPTRPPRTCRGEKGKRRKGDRPPSPLLLFPSAPFPNVLTF